MKPLPQMGLGMAALGRPGYINLDRSSVFGGSDARSIQDMQSRANTVLDALFQQQKKPWVDCARSYGLSEKFVGEYLRDKNIAPEDVYVSSKWGYCKYSRVELVQSSAMLRKPSLYYSNIRVFLEKIVLIYMF